MNTYLPRPEFGPSSSLHAAPLNWTRQSRIRTLVQGGFPYSRKLSAHNSCVNALKFSLDGRWLASAGDDPYILLWNFHQDDVLAPSHVFRGPRSNVFTLAFSAHNQFLFSGDTNSAILKYDLTSLSPFSTDPALPSETLDYHSDNIRAISCHPELDEVFLSASEDGRILLHDGRADHRTTRAQATLQHTCEWTDVQYHPTLSNIFVTADRDGQICLRDMRMAFGPLRTRSSQGVVHKYITTLSKPSVSSLCRPEAGSVTFDRTGSQLAVTFVNYYPTIYDLTDPQPLAICSGRFRPDGTAVPDNERTYSNSFTIKHGSFGGFGLERDEYYSAGSDDFRAYVWRIPEHSLLKNSMETIPANKWVLEDPNKIAFASHPSKDRYIPAELSTPLFRLTGHESIINSTVMHPHLPFIATAGIERHVLLHSPTATTPCTDELTHTPTAVRELPEANFNDRRRMLRALIAEQADNELDQDRDTIALFDEFLRTDGNADVFHSRRWDPDSDEDETRDYVDSDPLSP